MKPHPIIKLYLKSILAIIGLFANIQTYSQNKTYPNVIVILSDDIGVGDISSYRRLHDSNIKLETPNIDKLAQNGAMFTNAYAPAALCATSRYAIMTGNYNYRSPLPWGVWSGYLPGVFTKETLTLGRLMQHAGYSTAFVGKWHLGTQFKKKSNPKEFATPTVKQKIFRDIDITKIAGDGPMQNGFDYSFTLPSGIQNVPYAAYENDLWYPLTEDSKIDIVDEKVYARLGFDFNKNAGYGDSNWDPSLLGPLLVSKVTNFISEHAKGNKPFFLYYCTQAVHYPHAPPKKLDGIDIKETTPSRHMDMIKELDVQIGMIVKTLKELGIYENTVFIFTSDNGGLFTDKQTLASGHNPSDIYRGHKNTSYEGGNRVPFIVSWPQEIGKNKITENTVIGVDIMATIAAIANAKIPEGQAKDSYNLLPLLKEEKDASARKVTILQAGNEKQVMIIEDGWKLIMQMDKSGKDLETRTPIALFNLKNNIEEHEERNLINDERHKNKVMYLLKMYNTIRDSEIPQGKHF